MLFSDPRTSPEIINVSSGLEAYPELLNLAQVQGPIRNNSEKVVVSSGSENYSDVVNVSSGSGNFWEIVNPR
jgi:hypothetical protein